MAVEIEHKYLINQELWKKVVPTKSSNMTQAYLSTDPLKTIRIRTTDEKGFITIKGKTNGASRLEFEYEIPRLEAIELIENFTEVRIEKIRHYVIHENKTWEVDQFLGLNEGLWVAEIELTSEDEKYSIPNWIEKNVTTENKYSNSNLCRNPYKSW